MLRTTITTLLSLSSLVSVSAFGIGPPCKGIVEGKPGGNCIQKSDCTTNEWFYGKASNPVCDIVGSDSSLPTTKVCCYDIPEQVDDSQLGVRLL